MKLLRKKVQSRNHIGASVNLVLILSLLCPVASALCAMRPVLFNAGLKRGNVSRDCSEFYRPGLFRFFIQAAPVSSRAERMALPWAWGVLTA